MIRLRRRQRAGGPAGRTRRGVSLASRLAAALLAVGLVSLIAATVVGVSAGQSLGRAIVDGSLGSQRTAGSLETAAQLRYYQRLVEQLASSPQSGEAIDSFAVAVDELATLPAAQLRDLRERLISAYQGRYFEPLQALGESLQVEDILATRPAAVYLQGWYSLPDPPVTDPSTVTDAGDGSTWSAVHAEVHGLYRNALLQGGLQDIYLVDAADRIVYSVAKGPDLGTSLEVGPFSGSLVARAASAAADSDGGVVTDLSYYRPVPGMVLGAAAAAVSDGARVVGTIVITYDASVYTQRLTALVEASAEQGEHTGGDLYLIGADDKTRSDPQTFLADPQGFVTASTAAGVLTAQAGRTIERTGTTVLVQPAADATSNAAADGDVEVEAAASMTGTEVVSTVDRVPFEGIVWYTVAERGAAGAQASIDSFRRVLLVGASTFLVVLAFVAVAWARGLMGPVRLISEGLSPRAVAQMMQRSTAQPLRIPDRSPVEYHRLADSLNATGRALRQQQSELDRARAEGLGVLERLLPASIARRIAKGDIERLDEVPSATVAVVVVLGLGELVGLGRGGDRNLLDELHAQIDGIAADHGLDRIKVVGDSYFGACGHDRPFIDHAPRAVAFAEEVAQAVRGIGRRSPARLAAAVGIASGPVMVGMSGGTRLLYDVWGPTVTAAHALARTAGPGQILITRATKQRLPEDVELAAWTSPGGPPGEAECWLVAAPAAAGPGSGTAVAP